MELIYLGRNRIEEKGRKGRWVGLGPGDGRDKSAIVHSFHSVIMPPS